MSGRRLDAVLFDLDGTLADSMTPIAEALVETLASFGHATTVGQVMPAFGPSMTEVIRRLVPVDENEAERIYQDYLPRYYEHYMPRSRALPGTDALVAALGERLRLAIVTSKIEAGARSLVAHLGWSEHFAVVVGRDTSAGMKPSPEPARYAIQSLGAVAEQCAFVGDMGEDMQCAASAGIPLRIGLTGLRTGDQLRLASATHTTASLDEVYGLLVGASA